MKLSSSSMALTLLTFWSQVLSLLAFSAAVRSATSSSLNQNVFPVIHPKPTDNDDTAAGTTTALVRHKECVVVGGGPIGLATALTLSHPPHCYNVTVLEKADVYNYDPSKAYLYNVGPRGLQWCDRFPDTVMKKLEQRGSFPHGGVSSIYYAPADPSIPLASEPKKVRLSGSVKLGYRRNYWIPRHTMVELLVECCREQEAQRLQSDKSEQQQLGSIQILYGKEFDKLDSSEDHILTVRCKDGSSYSAALVVGADGIDSPVRAVLAGKQTQTTPSDDWLQSKASMFHVIRKKSPATGVRLKALQFPPGFTIPNTTHVDVVQTEPETIYIFEGVLKGTRKKFRMGFLPMKNASMIRPGNVNSRPDHEFWKIRNGPEMKQFFQTNFPRMDFDAIISDQEWERFAKAEGTTFPYCQYSPGSALGSPSRDTGIVLVGDACHAFPPDIGQGINAGYQDVNALDRALQGLNVETGEQRNSDEKKPFLLADALEAYQSNRGPEHKALIQLARCGAPYQYRQTHRRDQVGAFLWTSNVAFRLLLNKLSFGLVPPAAIVIAQDHDLNFLQIMRRAHFASRSIKLVIWFTVLRLLWIKFMV